MAQSENFPFDKCLIINSVSMFCGLSIESIPQKNVSKLSNKKSFQIVQKAEIRALFRLI